MNIGSKITLLRQQLNISSRQLALNVGMSPGYLSDIEKGVKQPTIEMLNKICIQLNVTLSEFFSDEAKPILPKQALLLETIKKLTPQQLEKLIEFLKLI